MIAFPSFDAMLHGSMMRGTARNRRSFPSLPISLPFERAASNVEHANVAQQVGLSGVLRRGNARGVLDTENPTVKEEILQVTGRAWPTLQSPSSLGHYELLAAMASRGSRHECPYAHHICPYMPVHFPYIPVCASNRPVYASYMTVWASYMPVYASHMPICARVSPIYARMRIIHAHI